MRNEVATIDTGKFDLATLTGDMADAVSEEMDGLGAIPFDRVKIPSGGGLAFELPGETDDDAESATELIGVILDHNPMNSYWAEKFSGGNEQPDCASTDGKIGMVTGTGATRACATCPYNQFGSAGAGKACKNSHRVFLLREGNPVPLILTLPPTSIRYFRDYVGKRIILKGLRCWQVVTKVTLKKEKSRDGIVYSRAAFTFMGVLPPEMAKAAESMRGLVRAASAQMDEAGEGHSVAGPDDFVTVPDGDESVPF